MDTETNMHAGQHIIRVSWSPNQGMPRIASKLHKLGGGMEQTWQTSEGTHPADTLMSDYTQRWENKFPLFKSPSLCHLWQLWETNTVPHFILEINSRPHQLHADSSSLRLFLPADNLILISFTLNQPSLFPNSCGSTGYMSQKFSLHQQNIMYLLFFWSLKWWAERTSEKLSG